MADILLHSIQCLCFDLKTKEVQKEQKFSVCSEIDDTGKLIPHMAQCPYCGNIHYVVDLGKSTLHGKDESASLPNIDELEFMVPNKVAKLLQLNKAPIYKWVQASLIFKHKLFPNIIVLSQEETFKPNTIIPEVITKMLIINDEQSFEIETDISEPLAIAKP